MGLDMYLYKFPRYKDTTPDQIDAIAQYCEWINAREKKLEYATDSFAEYAPYEAENLPDDVDVISFYSKFATKDDWNWVSIGEEVAYWRKANAIHAWFVERVQGGEDDCRYHKEVTKDIITELRDICAEVIEKSILALGDVRNGQRYSPETGWEDIIEQGKLIINPEVADELLPTRSGFFFGSTDYDQWYMNDIISTYKQLTKILEETDFEKDMIYYSSSW